MSRHRPRPIVRPLSPTVTSQAPRPPPRWPLGERPPPAGRRLGQALLAAPRVVAGRRGDSRRRPRRRMRREAKSNRTLNETPTPFPQLPAKFIDPAVGRALRTLGTESHCGPARCARSHLLGPKADTSRAENRSKPARLEFKLALAPAVEPQDRRKTRAAAALAAIKGHASCCGQPRLWCWRL